MARAPVSTCRSGSSRWQIGGQTYAPRGGEPEARLDVSRPSNGYAFRLRFPLRVEGPCMRCLEGAAVEVEIDAREVDQSHTEDEELRSPYVVDDELDLGRWAHDAAILALPNQILCRPDCAGLCPDLRRIPKRRRPRRPRTRHRHGPPLVQAKRAEARIAPALRAGGAGRPSGGTCETARPPAPSRVTGGGFRRMGAPPLPRLPHYCSSSSATGCSSSRPASRSRPRCTAARNFCRLTSSVLRISSA